MCPLCDADIERVCRDYDGDTMRDAIVFTLAGHVSIAHKIPARIMSQVANGKEWLTSPDEVMYDDIRRAWAVCQLLGEATL